MDKTRLMTIVAIALGLSRCAVGAPDRFNLTSNPNHADAVVMFYEPATGYVRIRGNNVTMTSFQLESASSSFISQNADLSFCVGPFDVCTPGKMFTLRTDGVSELALGNVLPRGLSADTLTRDLLVDGSMLPSGTIDQAPGGGPYLIPEPSGLVLMLLGAIELIRRRRSPQTQANGRDNRSYELADGSRSGSPRNARLSRATTILMPPIPRNAIAAT